LRELAKKVNLESPIDVDSIVIEKDPFHPNAYIVDFALDSEPCYIWQTLFDLECRSSLHLWDRKVMIVGKKLKLVTTPNDIKSKVEWLEKTINATNKRVEEYNQNQEKIHAIEEEKKKDIETIKVIRTDVKTKLSKWAR